jgi:uncharacterized membrane protein
MFKATNYNSKYLYWITILSLIVFNIIQKISYLDAEPFWYDEIISVKATLQDFGHVKHMSEWDNNPPFYYYSLWVWLKIVGVSEFNARLLSVIFCALSACMLFVISKKYFNYKTALGAALIFSMHNFVYTYCYEARCYSLVVLLVLISTHLFLKLLQSNTIITAVLLGLVNFLIVYTHYIAGMVLFFQLLLILILKRKLLKPYLISIGTCLVFVLIRFTKKQFLLILAYEKGADNFWLKTATVDSLYTSVINLFSGTHVWALLLLLFLIATGIAFHRRKSMDNSQTLALVYTFVIGGLSIIILFIIGLFKPLFLDRYLLFTTPFIAIAASWLLFNNQKIIQLLIIPVLCLQLLSLNFNPQKNMNYKLTADVVRKLRGSENRMVILQTKDITGLFAYYYSKELFMNQKNLIENLKKNRVFEIENSNNLSALSFKDENYIIFCQTFEKPDDNIQIFDIFKQNNYVFTSTKIVKGVKISLLKKK